MPTYKYKCSDCGTEFEVIQKISDEPLRTCEVCGKSSVQRLLFASAFQLKGAGWYQTDYASGKSNTASSSSNLNKTKVAENSSICDSENLTVPKACADCQDKPAPTNA
ncbi:MAG: zinc ribbon domain-containing protein [Deltaproteobacteria bacterium]|jgi:putative FmdB family regulatory protein|nr:zinc ribbon domain-containing protein [Deltaproteobacteria bacterium]